MDIVTEKVCTGCLKLKPLSEFGKSSKAKDGKRSKCRECHNFDNRKWTLEHKEWAAELQRKRYLAHPETLIRNSKKWQAAHPEKWKEIQRIAGKRRQAKIRELYKDKRIQVINAYGGKCVCCGETTYEFLAIDHVNGGGRKERRQTSPDALLNRIIKGNYPPRYRILCHNCNLAIGFYGYCPHNRKSDNER